MNFKGFITVLHISLWYKISYRMYGFNLKTYMKPSSDLHL